MTFEQAEATVKAMSGALGTTLSFGYTGDCSPGFDPSQPQRRPHNYDARRWAIWFDEFPRGLGEQYPRGRPSLNLGNTEECFLLDEFALRTMIAYRFRRLSEMAAAEGGKELPATAQQPT
jgi:hypothetical protein